MRIDEFMRTLTTKTDVDAITHVVAPAGIPNDLVSTIRPKGSTAPGHPADTAPEYFPGLNGRFSCWWIRDDEEIVMKMDGETRVWPRDRADG